ncbi:ABC transporter substrate-binding protein [Streptomyces sp. MAA16]|uniref:ABC transporter substrate-binding protein n=1 Tax=Streptomyces TaxID=1883 RepID=UPI00247495C6|nr:ABC transporter substrate-binding protein [Streptomyces sp. MAA16]MDH6697339.1 branched-chain amino acid transport system substrate-binding protein [Streptomyces sp. MAA16]
MFLDPSPRSSRAPRLFGAVALALALTAVTGCGGPGDGPDDTLKVGLVASLSGTYKPVGTELRDGFELYLRTHGGELGGRPAELVVADEGDGPQAAVPATTRLVEKEKVDVLTGFVSGGSVNAVLPLVERAGIPFVGSNARPAVKDLDRVWTTSFLSDEPGRAIAPYVEEAVDGPVYAIGPDYQGGYDQLRGFTDEFERLGGKLANPGGGTTWTPFPRTTDFRPYFARIARSDAKAVYCFYAGRAAIDFARQYARSEIADLPLYTAFVTEGSVLDAQGDAAKGIYSVLNYAADLDNEANRRFVADWTARHASQPTTYAMSSYDAAAVLDKAVADAAARGAVTPETVNRAIGGLGQIDSPRGAWEFGRREHSPVQTWYLRQVRPDGTRLANVMVEDLATLGD